MRWIKCHSENVRIHGELAWWFRHMDNGGYQTCPTQVLWCVTTVRGWPWHLSLSAHLLELHFAFSRIYRYGMSATMPSKSFPDGRVNTIRNASHFRQFEHELCSCINYWWWQQSMSSIISEVGSLSQYGEGLSLILQNLKCKSVVHDQNNLGTLLMGWLWRMANHEWVHCFPWILQIFKVRGILVQWQHDIYSTQMDMLHQMNGRLKVAYYREDISFCEPVGIPITFVASVVKS